jgi:hypothetical protein
MLAATYDAGGLGLNVYARANHTGAQAQSTVTNLVSDLAAKASLTGSETLTNKTLTAPVVNSPTGIVKGDVGLGNVDNTSNATERAATATLTNKTISGASNTLSAIPLASMASIADDRVLANISGGSAAGAANTLTAILDKIIGSTRGMILRRGAATWGAPTAPSSGNVLTFNGTDALWSAPAGGGGGPTVWAYFATAGTLGANSGNISSVTKNSTGNWTVNLSVTLASATYSVVATVVSSVPGIDISIDSRTTTSFVVKATYGVPGGTTPVDPSLGGVSFQLMI